MPTRPTLPHVPALDGLRGTAVIGVIAFHYLRYTGGYLGVDLFFVLSGYLITSLLLVEREANGSVSLGAFWARRARRLLPALFVVLLAVSLYARFAVDPTRLDALRGDALATLFYVANWRSIVSEASYWAMFNDPSPLQHTWSLAIEEQFYVVWPLIAWVVLGRARRRPAGAMLAVCLVGLAASATAQLLLYRPGTDPSRVYFGTDTRIAAILMGASLACATRRFGRPTSRRGRTALELAGWGGAVVLGVCWTFVDGQDPFLYRGGLLLCGVAATLVLAAATQPEGGPLSAVFSVAPLRTVGAVSYGLYLWHWPVLVALSPERTHLEGPVLFLARIATAAALTGVSYVVLEQPIRHGALKGWVGRLSAPAAIVVTSVAIVACTAAPPAQTTSPDTVAAALAGSSPAGTDAPPTTTGTTGSAGTIGTTGGTAVGTATTARPASTPTTTGEAPAAVIRQATAALGHTPKVLIVGDSVAYSIAKEMIPVQAQLGLDISSKVAIGCGFARGGRVRFPDGNIITEPDACQQWPTTWKQALEEHKPDLVVLMVGWPGSTARELQGEFRRPCDPVFDQWYESEVRLGLEVLRSTGVPLSMIDVPYYRSEKAPPGNDDNVDCLNAEYARIIADENAKATAAGQRARVVATIDLARYVCPEGRTCRTTVNGVTMRKDGLHYDGPAGVIVGTWAVAQGLAGTVLRA